MKVLVAIDDSHYSKHLLHAICKRHWPADTSFKILNVLEPFSLSEWNGTAGKAMEKEIDIRRHHHAERLCSNARHEIEQHIPDAIVHFEVRTGKVDSEIIDAAAEWEAGKIIIGAHGRSVCPHNLLGSVSRRVAETAQCSVEIIKDKESNPHKSEFAAIH
jgi:nucleotide-binding universal stress UspA family protein